MADNPLLQFGSEFISGLFGSVNLRDYQHASKTFHADNNARMPKFKSWFHVYFEFNRGVAETIRAALGPYNGPDNRFNWLTTEHDQHVLGILVKSVRLPGFKFDVKTHNQYNRKNLAINKIHYDPIEITFHDDMSNIIRDFWFGYYQYYNQDPRYTKFIGVQQGVNIPDEWSSSGGAGKTSFSNAYDVEMASNWGLDTQEKGTDTAPSPSAGLSRTTNAFKSIRIYQFSRSRTRPPAGSNKAAKNNARYTEYVLVNPVITSFSHDTLDYSENGFSTHTMNIDYETVLYNSGLMGNNEIASWTAVQQRFFDVTPSPLSTNVTSTIIGSGGITDSVQNIISQLQSGNPAAAAILAGRLGLRASDIAAIARGDINDFARTALARGDINDFVRTALTALASGKEVGFPAIGP